ncbi:MAG TPA: flavocytochrome c [Bacilli bacterium]|nr:flavocytochrome c [Bacilli bacterium]
MMWDAEVDVVVAGAGGCGLVAALTAAEQGLEVAIFEKTEFVLGNTAASAGMIPAAGTRFQREIGIIETPEEMAEDILKKNHYESDEQLTLALCKVSSKLVEWMNDHLGIELTVVEEFKYPGHRNFRMHAPPSRAGLDLMKSLRKNVSDRDNIYLMLKSQVMELIVGENNEVIGVVVHSDEGVQRVKAKKVILATNGFGGNKAMVQEYIPEISEALYFGYEANTGEGIEMAMKIGAGVDCMGAYQGHSAINEASGLLVTWGTIMMGGFMINENGYRFGNEAAGYSEFASEVLKQPGQYGYIIFDQQIYESLLSIEDFKNLNDMKVFKSAETIEELAEKLSVSDAHLKETVTTFDQQVDGQEDEFARNQFPKKLTAPYYAVKVVPAMFHTQGGLKINTNAQVLNKDGEVIQNLYAGGGAAVGVSGRHAYGYMSGNGLLAALGFGKIAGEHATEEILKQGAES